MSFFKRSVCAREALSREPIQLKKLETIDATKFGFACQPVRSSARPLVRTGRERLIRFCKGGVGESKTSSLRLSW